MWREMIASKQRSLGNARWRRGGFLDGFWLGEFQIVAPRR